MFNDSRIAIYDYLYSLFFNTVTQNVYRMNEPAEMTESDVENGFIVIRIGDFVDESEFSRNAFGSVRVFIYAYIPPKSRGRLDKDKYAQIEQAITDVIENAEMNQNDTYSIQDGSVLSADSLESSGENFYIFVKSFIVNICNTTN